MAHALSRAALRRLQGLFSAPPKPASAGPSRALHFRIPSSGSSRPGAGAPGFHAPPRRPAEIPLAALRTLARNLFQRRFFTSQPNANSPHRHLPGNLHGRVRAASGRPLEFGGASRRLGPGGLGSGGPRGPSVSPRTSVANVGLGSSRAYSSASQPMFAQLAHAPLYLRALIDGTEDKIDEFKRKRPTTLHLRFTKTSATRAAALSSLAAVISEKTLSKVQVPEIAAFTPEDECSETDAAVYFGVSPEHSLPPASTPTTTTSLLIPFALSQSIEPSDDYSPSSGVPLSRFVFAHRAAYALHAKRVDALLGLLERQGAFLDPQIASHEVRDDRDTGALIGIKIEFVGRSEEEVRRILSCAGGQTTVDDGEGQWFFLSSRPRVTGNEDDDLPLGAEAANFLVFPTVSLLSLESTPAPPPPARSASSGIPTTPSGISLSLSDISLSLSDTEMLPSPFSSSSVTSPSSFVDEQDNSAHWEDLPSPDAALSAFSGASSIFEIDQELDIFSSAVWSDAESRSGRDTGSSSSSAGSMAMSMEPF